jgi:hypothetical protein
VGGLGQSGSQSVARASGLWFATALSIGFVLTQSNDFAFDSRILPALAFWVPIGVLLDIWSRRRPAIEPFDRMERYTQRSMMRAVYLAGVAIVAWTIFRPDAAAPASGGWIAIADSVLDRVELVLPGLGYSRSALRTAGRPDVAAYFGAYQVCVAILWVVGVAMLGRWLSAMPVNALGRGGMAAVLANAYPANPTAGTYLRRFAYACTYWSLLIVAVGAPWAIWRQDVTDTGHVERLWHNAITGIGGFAFAVAIVLGAVPLAAYLGLVWRTALRRHRPMLGPRDDGLAE